MRFPAGRSDQIIVAHRACRTPEEEDKARELAEVIRASLAASACSSHEPLPEKVLADSVKCGADEVELHRLAEIGRRAEALFKEDPPLRYADSVYSSPGSYTAAAWAWFRAYLLDGKA